MSTEGAHTVVSGDAEVNGTRLHYLLAGKGPAVVLLHGWPLTSAEWRPVLPLLAAAGYTAIAPDLRGLGDSARAESGYDKRNVAEDVRQLAAHLGFQDVALVGSDIGTMVAFAYAVATPERVRHLVLAESLLPGFGLEELMNPATGGFWHFGFHMQVDVAEMLTAGKEAAYLGPMWGMFSLHGMSEEVKAEYLRQYSSPGGMRAGFQHYATLVEDGAANRAGLVGGKLPMPVLVINGEHGLPQAPLLAGVRQVAERVEADIVPSSAHAMGEDNPTWLAERLVRFLSQP